MLQILGFTVERVTSNRCTLCWDPLARKSAALAQLDRALAFAAHGFGVPAAAAAAYGGCVHVPRWAAFGMSADERVAFVERAVFVSLVVVALVLVRHSDV